MKVKKRIVAMLIIIILLFSFSINTVSSNTSNSLDETIETSDNENKIDNKNNVIENKPKPKVLTEEEKQLAEQLNEDKIKISEKLNSENKKLEYVKEELSAVLIEVQELDDKIQEYSVELTKYGKEIDTLQKSIDVATRKLKLLETDCEQRQETLTNRLVAVYKAGDVTFLEVLLSSKSLTEFVSSYYLIKQITEYDNDLLEQVEQEKELMEQTKGKLEREQNEITKIKAKKEQTTVILENTKTLQQEKAKKLTAKEKNLQNVIIQYKREYNRIQNQISAITGETNLQLQYTGGDMIWPVAKAGTVITSYYSTRKHPISGIMHEHSGIDIGNAYFGTPIVAVLDGVVAYAGELGGYGNCVIINHGDGLSTVYGHGQAVLTTLNKKVKQGELIMEVGSTGVSTGPHLHFEVRINGYTVNPLQYVKAPV